MVLESLFNPFVMKKKPWEMFFVGCLYSFIGLALSYFVFREISGILMVFLIVFAALPLVYTTFKDEEELDVEFHQELPLLREHGKVILFLLFFFLGTVVALSAAYIFLPSETTHTIFRLQEEAITNVNQYVQGSITGNAVAKFYLFSKITLNNLKVLFFCVIFSLLYGTGAIFILTWNASVIAAAMGNLIKVEFGKAAAIIGIPSLASYFSAVSFGFFRYMTHGVFEILAYFIAGLAGGILSMALINHNWDNEQVLIDTIDLLLISLGFLVVAGFIEVYITPAIFA